MIYNLTGKYVTDASNASRTYLCNLNGTWDESLLKLFKIKKELNWYPKISLESGIEDCISWVIKYKEDLIKETTDFSLRA